MAFDDVWARIQRKLRVGTVVPNWTHASGRIGEDFRVTEVVPTHVVVDPPGAKNVQRISREDFQKVYEAWADYLLGVIPRAGLRDRTNYSKYIISIYRWLQDQ